MVVVVLRLLVKSHSTWLELKNFTRFVQAKKHKKSGLSFHHPTPPKTGT
jgi:hypothetical protein